MRSGCGFGRSRRTPALLPFVQGWPAWAPQWGHSIVSAITTEMWTSVWCLSRRAITGRMPRASKTGIQGLFREDRGEQFSGKERYRYRINLRYIDPATGLRERYQHRFPPGTPTRAAEQHAKDVLSEAIRGVLTKRIGESASKLSVAFGQYLGWVATNRPKAHHDRKSIASVWVEAVGDVAIERLGPELVERYKAKRLEAGAKPATINRGVAMVKHMAGLAARSKWPWMTRERALAIREVGMLKEPPGRQRPIKPAELKAIMAAFQRTDARFARRVVAATLLTGCRLGEIVSLRDANVNLAKHEIDLSETKQNRNHQIVVTAPLATLVKESRADRPKGLDVVFPNSHGKAYTVSGFSKHFAHVAERAGVPDITFHDLRRHVGTLLINSGERLEVVSKLLGHSNVAVTQRSYAHLATEATRGAFNKLAEVGFTLASATSD